MLQCVTLECYWDVGLHTQLYKRTLATNVYNSVTAPTQRGFSYVEIWMLGVQIPILTGVVEYGILLAMKKYHKKTYLHMRD